MGPGCPGFARTDREGTHIVETEMEPRPDQLRRLRARNERQLLWLEDLSDAPQALWNAGQFTATVCNLSQFNAHWPQGAMPRRDWISRKGIHTQFRGGN